MREHFLTHSVRASITLISKPDKDNPRKLQTNIPSEHGYENLKQYSMENQIQQHNKKIIHNNQVDCVLEC